MHLLTSALTHTLMYNRHELATGFKSMWRDTVRWIRKLRGKPVEEESRVHFGDDIHFRLMQAYPEVPEWWFTLVVLASMVLSFLCLGIYTEVSPAVVMIAPIVTIIFIIPVGIVTAVSGLEPSLNLVSQLIGGGIAPGDTMTVQYFRMFGSEPVYHALLYANDLKLSHYVKIAPRHMFWVQMWGALVGTVVSVGQWNWLMNMEGICTPDAPFHLICPGGTFYPRGSSADMKLRATTQTSFSGVRSVPSASSAPVAVSRSSSLASPSVSPSQSSCTT